MNAETSCATLVMPGGGNSDFNRQPKFADIEKPLVCLLRNQTG